MAAAILQLAALFRGTEPARTVSAHGAAPAGWTLSGAMRTYQFWLLFLVYVSAFTYKGHYLHRSLDDTEFLHAVAQRVPPEAPVLLQAFAKLRHRPDVVMIDGQGIAHPRRLGIASHLGLWLRVPTIG